MYNAVNLGTCLRAIFNVSILKTDITVISCVEIENFLQYGVTMDRNITPASYYVRFDNETADRCEINHIRTC